MNFMIKKIDLPYPLDALEPYYSKETLKVHYETLYTGYVENTNKTFMVQVQYYINFFSRIWEFQFQQIQVYV